MSENGRGDVQAFYEDWLVETGDLEDWIDRDHVYFLYRLYEAKVEGYPYSRKWFFDMMAHRGVFFNEVLRYRGMTVSSEGLYAVLSHLAE